jgi:Ca2+-dependent lipid-binding protein
MDDMAHPVFSTAKIRSKSMKFDDIGDAMIRELEFSKINLRLREDGDHDEDGDHLAKLSGSTLETLKQCMVSVLSQHRSSLELMSARTIPRSSPSRARTVN